MLFNNCVKWSIITVTIYVYIKSTNTTYTPQYVILQIYIIIIT